MFAVQKVKRDAPLADESIQDIQAFFFAQLIHKLPYVLLCIEI